MLLFGSSLVIAFSTSLIQRFHCYVPELKWGVSPLFSQPKDEFPCENDEANSDDSGDDDDDDENEVHIHQLNNLHAVFCNSSKIFCKKVPYQGGFLLVISDVAHREEIKEIGWKESQR